MGTLTQQVGTLAQRIDSVAQQVDSIAQQIGSNAGLALHDQEIKARLDALALQLEELKALLLESAPKRLVFATSTTRNGNLGGVAGADAICGDLASAAGLSGTFLPWLSDDTVSPSTRFVRSSIPYELVDGTLVAESYAALTTGGPLAPINRDETGNALGVLDVWTGTFPDGSANTTFNCANWTSATGEGRVGNTGALGTWSGSGQVSCATGLRLYCFQQ